MKRKRKYGNSTLSVMPRPRFTLKPMRAHFSYQLFSSIGVLFLCDIFSFFWLQVYKKNPDDGCGLPLLHSPSDLREHWGRETPDSFQHSHQKTSHTGIYPDLIVASGIRFWISIWIRKPLSEPGRPQWTSGEVKITKFHWIPECFGRAENLLFG
jgi:hypothetical protein